MSARLAALGAAVERIGDFAVKQATGSISALDVVNERLNRLERMVYALAKAHVAIHGGAEPTTH
jgi:hypothetical protein